MAYSDPLRILMVASEAHPFAKTGGLGDVVGALPKALAQLGHEVKVVLPRYRCVEREKFGLQRAFDALGVSTGIGEYWCAVDRGTLPGSSVPIYFLDREDLYDRAGIYDGGPRHDHALRYTVLCRGALQLCRALTWKPDLIHCHDWHSALLPCLLNGPEASDFGDVATLLTLHNGAFQGVLAKEDILVTGLGWEFFHWRALEWNDALNILKGGILNATLLNAVSERYAWEIQTAEGGFGLDSVWRSRASDLYGIVNGIDYTEWHPSIDGHLAARFDADHLEGKRLCKADLQAAVGLPVRDDIPLFGWVGRLTAQKGIDIFAECLPWLLKQRLQIVLLGSGEAWAERYYQDMAWKHPQQFAARLEYNTPLAHRIEGGADFFLMPSAYEPCGLNQIYSLAYGTLPIVRATGGLEDTIQNLDEHSFSGTGFKFREYTAQALFDTAGWALWNFYHRPDLIHHMRRQAMLQRFAWQDSAEAYEVLYREAVLRRRGWI